MRLRSLAGVTCRRAWAVLLMVLVGVVPTAAYENDVHWGLTYWLAIKAGFKPETALKIAGEDQNDDEGDRDAVKLVLRIYKPLLWDKDRNYLSGQVYLYHFPSQKGPGNDPKARIVYAAREVARERLKSATSPEALGSALHRFQDSYSHQGEPDPPFMWGFHPYKDLTWGHPQKRGGYRSHDADLTSQHVPNGEPHDRNETVDMAHETYKELTSFLQSNRDSRYKDRDPEPWENLIEQVYNFAKADSIEKKQAWFDEYCARECATEDAKKAIKDQLSKTDYPYDPPVAGTDLRKPMQTRPTQEPKLLPVALQMSQKGAESSDSGQARPTPSPVGAPQKKPRRPSKWYLFWTWPVDAAMTVGDAIWRPPHQGEIDEVNATLSSYLESRIVRKDFRTDKQVPIKIDLVAELTTLLEVDCGPQPITGIEAKDFERVFWETFLTQNHGRANLYGHAVPNSQYYYGLYDKLPLREFGRVTDAIQSVEEKGAKGQGPWPYTFIPIRHSRFVSRRIGFSGRIHMVAFKFTYLPHDTAFIVLAKRHDAWTISELLWIAG